MNHYIGDIDWPSVRRALHSGAMIIVDDILLSEARDLTAALLKPSTPHRTRLIYSVHGGSSYWHVSKTIEWLKSYHKKLEAEVGV